MSFASQPISHYVEMECGRKGYEPRPPSIYPQIFFALLTVALGYAAFRTGGVDFSDWIVSLLLIGFASALYLLRAHSLPPLSPASFFLTWATILLPAYVAFQLLPMPLWLLRFFSPERAHFADNVAPVIGLSHFVALSINPSITSTFLLTVVGYVLVFVLVRAVTSRLADSVPWAPAIPLFLIGAIEAGIGLLQAGSDADVQGTYGSFDHFVGLLEMVLPFAVMYGALNIHRESEFSNLRLSNAVKACAAFAAAVLILLAALYSTSRMGTAATLGGLLVMGAFAVHRREPTAWRKAVSIGCLVILALLIVIYFSPNTTIARFGGLITNKDSRWPIWHDTLHLIAAFPMFGCGLGNYATAFVQYQVADIQNDYNYAHNDFLQLTSELGLVGFLILSALAIAIGYALVRATNRATDRRTRYLGLACIGGLSAIALHSLADFNLYIPANAMVLAWIAGISTGLPGSQSHRASRVLPRFALALSFILVAYASAWLVFNTVFQSDARAERIFCRFGICDTDSVLAAETLKHAGVAPESALARALSRDSASPLRWSDLGDAYLASKQVTRARYSFSRALELAPRIPPVLMRAATFYYATGQLHKALEIGAHVLESTDAEDAIVFDWYNANKVPVADVLKYGLPAGARTSQAYLRYLMGLGNTENSAAAWAWLLSQGRVDRSIAIDYTNFLCGQQQYESAAESWGDYLTKDRKGYLQSDWIYNGDFEGEPSNSSLDWKIQNLPGVEVRRDTTIYHSAGHSLRIQFDGKENLTYNHVSETVFVRPGDYEFQAYVRCEDITADQGVGFHIFDPETPIRADLKTTQLVGTTDWTKLEANVSVQPGTRILQIQIIRQPTWKLFDNATTGTAWIDDVKLLKID